MKTKLYIIICFLMAAGFSSCKKFLTEEPESSATTGNAYKTASDIEAALTGVYNSLYTEYFVWEFFLLSDVRSDNAYAGGDAQEVYQYDNLAVSPLNVRVFYDWQQLYNGIAKANLVLEKIGEVKDVALDQGNRRAQIIGEAKFLRALFYFELVKNFGDVPLVMQFGKIDPAEANVSKSPAAEVYTTIITDLNDALAVPDSYSTASLSKSRVTKGAVYALLAKVYAQKSDRDYNKVLENIKHVEELGYKLHGNYDELFDGSHYVNDEAILEIQYKASTPQANYGPQLLLPPSISGDDWRKYCTPSKDLIKAFDTEGDQIRKNSTVLFEDVEWSDEFWKPCASAGSVPFTYKWRHAEGWASGDYVYILRYADILLLKAEALNALGRSSEALAPLNMVRDRVDLPIIKAGDFSDVQLADKILNERRLELAFEGQRWSDLIRANKLESVMGALKEYVLTCEGGSKQMNYNMNLDKRLLPIPQDELNRNTKLIQNKGY
ncbi:RagB/SusD family nutrient uptake outer membrane protein [Pedobacter ginsengisoli]|uniref:RagB/SusD family nutrient uptake outer membrane protein n=1 Tax=Pedobacter ginsengisoli TaxID=363852 RepID=A0A2D1U5S7_9SPHI|nr:RagB/SusD family nutrient uptake outer membrane protein [Pedobacter ginsengisoli]ATP56956.1 RagB/SusD family nutrient uptake outer membrane protein [Pedobacter ginsengisoli]